MRAELENVYFSYHAEGKEILKGISLGIVEKTKTALMGRNGSGKTTLLKLLAGILKPRRGKVLIFTWEDRGEEPSSRLVGFAPERAEDYFFAPTVREEVEFYPKNMGLDYEKRARQAMEEVGISDLASRSPFSLSGGEGRLVSLASVLAGDPLVILMDEPTRGLQREGEKRVGKSIEKMDRTVLFSTHLSDFAYRFADEVALMKGGNILKKGKTRRVLAQSKLLEDLGLRVPAIVEWIEKNNGIAPPEKKDSPGSPEELARYLRKNLDVRKQILDEVCKNIRGGD